MKLIWYLSSITTIVLILLNNPNATSFGSIGSSSQLFSYTKSSQKKLQLLTIFSALIFVCITMILISNIII